jgi:hypothetical protein
MHSKVPGIGDGFVQDLIPLIKNGFVILRSILDVLIEKIEEIEKSGHVDIRKDTYASIIDALEAELENVHKERDTPTREAKIEVLQVVISILAREMEDLNNKRRKKKKRQPPHKIKVG